MCQLTQFDQITFHLPFSTLFASSTGYFVLFLESLCDVSPAFCSIGCHKLYNSVVFLLRIKRCNRLLLTTKACARSLLVCSCERLHLKTRTLLRQDHSHLLQFLHPQKLVTHLLCLLIQSLNLFLELSLTEAQVSLSDHLNQVNERLNQVSYSEYRREPFL